MGKKLDMIKIEFKIRAQKNDHLILGGHLAICAGKKLAPYLTIYSQINSHGLKL